MYKNGNERRKGKKHGGEMRAEYAKV